MLSAFDFKIKRNLLRKIKRFTNEKTETILCKDACVIKECGVYRNLTETMETMSRWQMVKMLLREKPRPLGMYL